MCDDGSADATPERFRAWEARDARVRYLRVEPNRGTPGATRNLGVREARGDFVAFLDDDDSWLPGKIARQLELSSSADVIGTNALGSNGSPYFNRDSDVVRPSRDEIVADNPLIVSTVMMPRQLVLDAGGFMTERWARGVADYGMWLAAADRGARFAVLGEPLAVYENEGLDRMSPASTVAQEFAVARLLWRHVRAAPRDSAVVRAALNRTAGATLTAARRHRPTRRSD